MIDKDIFRGERVTFIVMLLIFNLANILRAIYAYFVYQNLGDGKVALKVCNILAGAIFDLLPISLILFVHTRNFSDKG